MSDDYERWRCTVCDSANEWRNTNTRVSNINQHLDAPAHKHRAGVKHTKQSTLPTTFSKQAELTQREFDDLLVNATISANLSFQIVDDPYFRRLLTAGHARRALKGRRAMHCQLVSGPCTIMWWQRSLRQ